MKNKPVLHRSVSAPESFVSVKHSSGLTVLFSKLPYTAAHAIYAVNYGGACDSFMLDGKREDIPAGIAHFLEHKLFETADGGDAYDSFSLTGADANAFTSYSQTAYLFTASEKFYETLKILIDFVNDPHWTEKSVKKEQGIILQELKMYEDSPWQRVHSQLMRSLYKHHPVRHEIVGTEDSILQITPEHLYKCHKAFYTPENMVLCIAGDLELDRILEVLDSSTIINTEGKAADFVYKKEPSRPLRRVVRSRMEVASPMFSLGIKDNDIPKDPYERLKRGIALNIFLLVLFGESSDLYNELYDSGLVFGAMYSGCSYTDSFSYCTVSGESEKPFTVKKRLIKSLLKAAECGIDREDFEITKRLIYSGYIKSLSSSQAYASELLNAYFDGVKLTDMIDAVFDLGYEEAYRHAKAVFKDEHLAFSVVEPIN